MPRTPTDRAHQRPARKPPLAHKISALRPLSSDARAQQITDVVDAFRRLRGSVVRFIRMFSAAHAENAPADALSAMGFRELLSTLEDDARTARFTRLPELERAIWSLLLEGRTNSQIATELALPHETFCTSLSSLLARLGYRPAPQPEQGRQQGPGHASR